MTLVMLPAPKLDAPNQLGGSSKNSVVRSGASDRPLGAVARTIKTPAHTAVHAPMARTAEES